MPDLVAVLLDPTDERGQKDVRSVGGELAHASDAQEGLLGPELGVLPSGINEVLSSAVYEK